MRGLARAERARCGASAARAGQRGLFEALGQRNQHQQHDDADDAHRNAEEHLGKDHAQAHANAQRQRAEQPDEHRTDGLSIQLDRRLVFHPAPDQQRGQQHRDADDAADDEFKTPLAVIGNYATLLQNPSITPEQRTEYARAISDGVQRLSSLITNILKLNKLENQQIYPSAAAYNLGEQLCECILGFEQLWEDKELELETDIDEDIIICADRELLAIVWNNLFSNAVKFTERGGTISCSLHAEGAQAVAVIADTGCGMNAETGARIFEKFYQGDTSHASQGNGLGLALVKKVIDITGGEISVSSVLGKGSTFTVRLGRQMP